MKYATETVNRRANARHMQTLGGCTPRRSSACAAREKKQILNPFNPNPSVVVSKRGNGLVVQSQDGAVYSRNTSHVKKLQPNEKENETCELPI